MGRDRTRPPLLKPRKANRRWMRKRPQVQTPIGPMDLWITLVVVVLVVIGLVMVYAATIGPADWEMGDTGYHLRRQLINLAFGGLALVAGAVIPYRMWRKLAYPLLVLSILMLAALLFTGITRGGATRWHKFGPFLFQPSELAKFAFIVYLARSIAEKTEQMKRFSIGFLPHVVVLVVIMILSLAQPDLGTCILLAVLMVMMLFVAGTRLSFILALFFASAPVVVKVIAGSSARMDRILAYIDPWTYRYDEGFQTVNALIALGSGGLSGFGLGAGHLSMGGFLPEAETDFILPVIGEEFGFIGVSVVLGLFVLLAVRGLAISWRARDDFGRFLAFGLTLLIGLQAAVNAAVSVGLLPIKGLTLPLVSLGGSSMLVTMLTLGVLLNLSRTPVLSADDAGPAVAKPTGAAAGAPS